MSEKTSFLAEFVGGCGTGRLSWALQPNGDLMPCVFLPKKLETSGETTFSKSGRKIPFWREYGKEKTFKITA